GAKRHASASSFFLIPLLHDIAHVADRFIRFLFGFLFLHQQRTMTFTGFCSASFHAKLLRNPIPDFTWSCPAFWTSRQLFIHTANDCAFRTQSKRLVLFVRLFAFFLDACPLSKEFVNCNKSTDDSIKFFYSRIQCLHDISVEEAFKSSGKLMRLLVKTINAFRAHHFTDAL